MSRGTKGRRGGAACRRGFLACSVRDASDEAASKLHVIRVGGYGGASVSAASQAACVRHSRARACLPEFLEQRHRANDARCVLRFVVQRQVLPDKVGVDRADHRDRDIERYGDELIREEKEAANVAEESVETIHLVPRPDRRRRWVEREIPRHTCITLPEGSAHCTRDAYASEEHGHARDVDI
eukprot:scaffold57429_cov27-Tisochrysis_lutea.AAC.8